MDPWLIVAGGGTAGHIVPGIVVAQELVRRGVDPKAIHFVGSERGIERTLVPDAGFDVTLLSGRGIQRRLTSNIRGKNPSNWKWIKLKITAVSTSAIQG